MEHRVSEGGRAREEIEIRRESPDSVGARDLVAALNAELLERYPETGTEAHFRLEPDEVDPGRGAFLVLYAAGTPLACGAVRRLDASTAEIKRMYVRPSARGRGLGRLLLESLEAEARSLGAARSVLETGPRQPEAVGLYTSAGYSEIEAFGEYEPSPLSLFLEKEL